MRKIISMLLILSGIITAVPAFAEGESAALDINAAIEYAFEHSPKIEKAEADIEKNKMSVREAKLSYERRVGDYEMFTSFEQALVMSGYYYKAAQIQLEASKRTLEETKSSLKTDVRKAFYSTLSAEDKTDNAKLNLEVVTEKYNNAEASYAAGTISRLELESFKLAVTNAKNSLAQAERTYKLGLAELKNTINMPADTSLTLSGEFNVGTLTYKNADEAKELAKSQNSLISIKEGRELAAERLRIAKGWYSSNEYGYTAETATYASTMASLYDSEISVNYGIDSAYNAILTLEENIAYLEEYTLFLDESAKASYLQYQLGMITSNDYIEDQQNCYKAQNDLMDVKLSYYIAVAQYTQLYSGSSDLA